MKDFKDIDLKLCHSCGTCVAVCPSGSLSMTGGVPKLTKECLACNLCYESCPGIGFHYPEFNNMLFGVSEADSEVGYYRSICIGHAADETVRRGGASGGVITALLSGLLKRGEIRGAIVLGMDRESPWLPKARIAASEEEILNAAKSKYTMAPVNETLRDLDGFDGDFAFVGLPCHVHGVRKLERLGWKNAKKIKYCIGTFCGFNMEGEATDFLIQKSKIGKESIGSLEYRGGDWPGGFLIRAKDGRKFFVEKHVYNHLNLMFVPRRCLVCPDLTNEFADISVGDAWNKEAGPGGWSTIIVRTEKGNRLIESALKSGDIRIKASDKDRFKEGHSHLVLYKKKGIFIRMKLAALNPDFRLRPPRINFNEKIFNVALFRLISFMKTGLARFLFRYIPIRLPGLLGKYMRNTINLVSRPKGAKASAERKKGLFHKIKTEGKYLTMKKWRLNDVGAHWDSVEDYDDINKETYSYFRRFTDGYRFSDLPKNSYILDICARTGNGALFFWEKGVVGRALCADFSPKMQAVCAKRLKESGVPFQQQLIESLPLPFKDGEFDAVLSFETAEHVPEPDVFIKELGRVLKKEGRLILSTPNHLWRPIHSLAAIIELHHSEGPCRFITRGRMHRYLNDAGFEVLTEKTTVLIPTGPQALIRFGEWLEEKLGAAPMRILGLRQIYICRKR